MGRAVGVPGAAEGPAGRRRRRPRRRASTPAAGRHLWDRIVQRRRPALAAPPEGPRRGRAGPQGPHRPRGQAGPRRHPRHRVRRAAAAARARPPRPRPALAHHPRRRSPSWRRRATSTPTTPASWPRPTGSCAGSSTGSSCYDGSRCTPCPTDDADAHAASPAPSATATRPRARPLEQLDAELAPPPGAPCASIHERLYFRPLLEAFAAADAELLGRARRRRGPAQPPSASPTASAPGPRCGELTRGLDPLVAPDAADAAAAARLAVGEPRPRPRPAQPAQPARRPRRGRGAGPRAFRESPEAARRLCHARRHQPPGRRHRCSATSTSSPACPTPSSSRTQPKRRAGRPRPRRPSSWRDERDEPPARRCSGGRTATCSA